MITTLPILVIVLCVLTLVAVVLLLDYKELWKSIKQKSKRNKP